MILPIRHDQSSVRRWPWVSLALMLLCLTAFLATPDEEDGALASRDDYLQQAANYWRDHAHLDAVSEVETIVAYDVMPNERSTYLELLRDFSRNEWSGSTDEEIAAQQAELDRLTAYGLGLDTPASLAGQTHPFVRFGYVPRDGFDLGLLTSIFMHGGWIHLLGNLFMFWLAGPAIEDRLGRPGFAAFFLAAGAFSAAFYGFFASDPDIPLIGASGAIAGTMGAFLIRFGRSRIKFAYFFLVGFRPFWGTFEAKAWLMLPLWLANELFQTWWDRSTGMSSGVAYEAHIGGFLFGAAVLGALRVAKLEERYLDPVLEAKVTHFVANPIVVEATDLRVAGNAFAAWKLLEEAFVASPDDSEIAFALWEAARAMEQERIAVDAMQVCLHEDVAQGQLELAASRWCELTYAVPDALCDATLLIRLLPVLREHEDPSFVKRLLRHIVDADNASTTPAIALQALDVARELDPPSALAAAERALESPELHPVKRGKLEELVAELQSAGVTPPAGVGRETEKEREAARIAEAEPEDRSIAIDFEPEIDPTPLADLVGSSARSITARFADAKVVEARPTAYDVEGETLEIERPSGERLSLATGRIEAISVAVIGDLGPRPVVLVDLVLNWRAVEDTHARIVRLPSDRFDPRPLSPGETDPRRALERFLARLLADTQAAPLPSREAVAEAEWARFDCLRDYEREVLCVDRPGA